MISYSALASEVSAVPPAITQNEHSLTQDQLCRDELDVICHAISHDLRAPLRSIESFSQVIFESLLDKLDVQTAAYFQRVIKASQQMSGLLDGLLQLTRVTRHVMRKTLVDLSDLAQHIAAQTTSLNPERNVKLTIAPQLSAIGDPLLLKLALEQLFENAWKFTQSQPSPEISFGGYYTDTGSVFYLSDNGVGFDMTYYQRLFGVFEPLHTSPPLSGRGIGLAIVKRILQRHDGTVWAEGVPGLGACFWFAIPNQPTHETTTLYSHGRRQRQRRDAGQDRPGAAVCQV